MRVKCKEYLGILPVFKDVFGALGLLTARRSPSWQNEILAIYMFIKLTHISCRFVGRVRVFLPSNIFIYSSSQANSDPTIDVGILAFHFTIYFVTNKLIFKTLYKIRLHLCGIVVFLAMRRLLTIDCNGMSTKQLVVKANIIS